MSEQIGLNYQATLDNQNAIGKLEESMKLLIQRLHNLEEKERARAREEHARDVLE